MTSAERAKEIVSSVLQTRKIGDAALNLRLRQDLVSAITAAITSAQNDKLEEAGMAARRQALEEAARICDAHAREWDGVDRCSPLLFKVIAREIRSLKSKD